MSGEILSGVSSALSVKLPAVHPALPRNAAGEVCRGSGRKVTLVGQSGNLDHVTMVCHLVMIVVEMYKDDLNIRNALVEFCHLGTALLERPGVGVSVLIAETQAVGFWPRSRSTFRSKIHDNSQKGSEKSSTHTHICRQDEKRFWSARNDSASLPLRNFCFLCSERFCFGRWWSFVVYFLALCNPNACAPVPV